jgi:hypothetical protein
VVPSLFFHRTHRAHRSNTGNDPLLLRLRYVLMAAGAHQEPHLSFSTSIPLSKSPRSQTNTRKDVRFASNYIIAKAASEVISWLPAGGS